ncbi:MAG: hypothetical protein EXR98_01605 [Gemmataceae bacterium]|nr:hypothetical protein [Gemmataceae bacterium]
MASFNLARWLRLLRRSRVKTIERSPRIRLHLEELESRLAPANFIWTGGSGLNSNWGTATNWLDGVAPSAVVSASDPADLIFGSQGASSLSPVDNISNLTVNSITISSNNYDLKLFAGTQAIKLGTAGSGSGTISVAAGITSATIEFPMALSAPSGSQQFFSIGSGSTLTLTATAALSGNSGSELTKQGTGVLELNADSSNFLGPINLEANGGTISIGHSNALGQGNVTVGSNSQIELDAGATNLTVGNSLTLFGPGRVGHGSLYNLDGNNKWIGPVVMGTNTNFDAAQGTSLELAEKLTDSSAPFNVTKIGPGTVIFSHANTYRGTTTVNDGILTIRDGQALGSIPTAGTTVNVNNILGTIGTLRLEDPTDIGFTVFGVPLTLNGTGFDGNGALNNFQANNTWTGPITLGSPSPAGVAPRIRVDSFNAIETRLFLTGVIGDVTPPTAPFNLTKTGTGDLVLAPTNSSDVGTANLYHGTTTIQEGTITLRDSQGLGPATKTALTTVQNGASLNLESNVGHVDSITNTVNRLNVSAHINIDGDGYNGAGALNSVSGINRYTVAFVQSPVQAAVTGTPGGNLVSGTTYYYVITAIDSYGESLASNEKTFTANGTDKTAVLSWSQVAGATGYKIYRSTISGSYSPGNHFVKKVVGGATLTANDTNLPAPTVGSPPKVLPIITIRQAGTGAAIGVVAEPFQTPTNDYFTNDYSLTITGGITDVGANQDQLTLSKVGSGHLILPNANTSFFGPTRIKQGWITIQDPNALGGPIVGVQEVQPHVTVVNPAALMFKPFIPGTSFTFSHNLDLTGFGIDHPFSLINKQGVLENLAGINTVVGNLNLGGKAGIGVEKVEPTIASNLTLTGETTGRATTINVGSNANGNKNEDDNVIDTSSLGGTLTINADVLGLPDDVRVYLGDFVASPGTAILVYDSTTNGDYTNPTSKNAAVVTMVYNTTTATATAVESTGTGWNLGPTVTNYAALPSTFLTIVLNQGGARNNRTQWSYTATFVPDGNGILGITKLGSQRLEMLGAGIYQGSVNVKAGVLRVRNNTALGAVDNATTVEPGAALELAPQVSALNGGLDSGLSIWNNHLTLNGTGNSAFGDAALVVLSKDVLWHGPLTLNSNTTVNFQSALANKPVNTLKATYLNPITGNPTLTGTTPTVDVTTSTPGGGGLNAAQTFTFGGTVTGGTFKLTYDDGIVAPVTVTVTFSTNPNTLIQNIANALSFIPALAGNFGVALVSPIIDVHPNSRLIVTGAIDDANNPTTNGTDLFVSGGGELVLGGANSTYRGTTFVQQGILTLQSGQALGGTGLTGVQELALSGAIAGSTQFTLSYAGAPTPVITYQGNASDAATIQTRLRALPTIGNNVSVIQANPGVFLITFTGGLATTTTLVRAQVTGGFGIAAVGMDGGTVVANNSQLQLEGGITVGGEPLVIQGTGNNLETAVQTFTVGSDTVQPTGTFALNFNGAATGTANLPFYTTAGTLQQALQNLTTINGVGGQVNVHLLSYYAGANETQQINFTDYVNGETYQLYFDPANGPATLGYNLTFPIFYQGNPFLEVANIVAALQGLPTIGAAGIAGSIGFGAVGTLLGGDEFAGFSFLGGLADQPLPLVQASVVNSAIGSVGVSRIKAGEIGSKTYSVEFQGSFAALPQPELTITAVAGSTNVTTPTTTIVGGSQNATPTQWFSLGPTPITSATVFNGGGVTQPSSGRVTGIDVQQSFADDIYISTAGGGYWKTIDGGVHWTPMFDNVGGAVTFGGAVTIAQNTPNLIYYGGGEGNSSSDSYYGSGVYLNGVLLTNLDGSNPLDGRAINRIVVDPTNTLKIWVAVDDESVTNGLADNAGIWRYDASLDPAWVNTTAAAGLPSSNTNYSDLVYDKVNDILYAGLGNAFGAASNDIIVSTNGGASWTKANIDTIVGATIGNIKLTVAGPNIAYASIADAVAQNVLAVVQTTDGGTTWTAVADYYGANGNLAGDYLEPQGWYDNAIVARTIGGNDHVFVGGVDQGFGTFFVQWSADAGATWIDISQDTATGMGPHTDVHGMVLDANNNLLVATDGGVWRATLDYTAGTLTKWDNLNGDLSTVQMNGVSVQPGATGVILGGAQDNGTFRFTGASLGWKQVDQGDGGGVRFVPTQNNVAYHVLNGRIQQSLDGGLTWNFRVFGSASLYFPFSVDPLDPNRLVLGGDSLQESLDQAASFNTLPDPVTSVFGNSINSLALAQYQGKFQPDPAFPTLTDVGANTYVPDTIYIANNKKLYVTKVHATANTWSPNRAPSALMAANTTIENLEVDPTDSNIVYVVVNGRIGTDDQQRVFVSPDGGQNWTDISAGLPDLPAWKLVIDPRTNDLYLGTDIGVYGTAISFATGTPVITGWQKYGVGLPNVQVKDLEIDTVANTVTIGTYGRGAWQFYLNDNTLPTAPANPGALRSISGNNSWTGPITLVGPTTFSANGSQALQNGLSASSLNILGSISDGAATNAYTLTKIGGGDILLSGTNTYAGVTDIREGNLDVRNANALGGATITGVQALTLVTPTAPTQHTPTLVDNAGLNPQNKTYYYQVTALSATGESIATNEMSITTTLLNQAIRVSWTPVTGAIGYNVYRFTAPAPYVSPALLISIPFGATSSYLDDGSIIALSNGVPPVMQFDLMFGTGAGSQTGALTYTGTAADAGAIQASLNGLTTIGGAAASVSVIRTGPGLFLITFAGSLASTTTPILPVVTSQPGSASVTPGGGTIVQYGAALELESNLNLEPVTLNGDGVKPNYGGHFTGAMRSLSNTNTYTGTVTLNTNATIGVESGSVLTFARNAANPNPNGITDNGVGYSLNKEQEGTFILQTPDSYGSATAGTTVDQGILNIQHSAALGVPGTTTTVRDGSQLQIQRSTVSRPTQNAPSLQAGGALAVGTTYYYVITAITPSGESVPSNEQSRTPTAGNRTVGLSWNAVVGATGYRVFRSTTPDVYTDALLTTINTGATTTFTDAGAAVGAGTPVGPAPVNVTSENLVLSGTGIAGTGAFLNVDGNNSWGSAANTLTLTSVPAFAPNTTPLGTVSFGVAKPTDTLTIGSQVVEQTLTTLPAPDGPLSTGLTKVGAGRLTLARDNTYSGTTYVNAGILRIQSSGSLGINAASDVQRITVFGNLASDKFTLTFNGQSTGQLLYNVPPTGGVTTTDSLLNALENLTTIGAGNVTVSQATITLATPSGAQTGYIYTVTFAATFLNSQGGMGQPLFTATPFGATNLSVNRVADGGIGAWVKAGAALELDGDPLGTASSISIPAAERLLLEGTTGVGGTGGLRNISGNNIWGGPVTLDTSAGITTDSIGADAGTMLTIVGVVQDPIANLLPSPIPPADLTKVGAGTLIFPTANSYTGNTFINEGALNIRDDQALGVNTSAVQTLAVNGTSSTFTLTFKTQTTGSLNVGLPASGGVGPTASLQNALNALSSINAGGGSVVVTQLGNVYSVYFNGPPLAMTAQPLLVATVAPGFGTTVDIAPAMLGAESDTVVAAGASLQLQHDAALVESSGKPLFLNGQGLGQNGALDSVAGSNSIAPTTPIALQSAASIGAEASALLSITQGITDLSQTQTLTFPVGTVGYTLSFDGLTTISQNFSGSSATNITTIRNVLNGLATIQLQGGSVTVAFVGSTTYTITFGGRMVGTNWPAIVGTRISNGAIFTATTAMNSNGFGMTKYGPGAADFTGTAPNLYTGMTNVVAGTLLLSKPDGVNSIAGDLTVGNIGIAEVQTVTITGTSGTFALTFNGQTTGDLAFNVPASGGVTATASMQNALTAVASIGGVGGTATVTKLGNVYTVTFGGTLLGADLPTLGVSGSAAGSAATVTNGGRFSPAGSAIAWLQNPNQIVNTSNVLVNGDGLLDLNGNTETFGPTLRIVDGQVKTGDASLVLLNGNSLNMTGGTITNTHTAAPGGIDLRGGITAISTATEPATIRGAGNVNLANSTRTFTVNDGPNGSDLIILSDVADLSGNINTGITKAGAGRLELGAANDYLGTAILNAGDVQVDSVENVTLSGFVAGNKFRLILNGNQTNLIDYTGVAATDAAAIQAALNTVLASLGAFGAATVEPIATDSFRVLFGSTLTGIDVEPMTGSGPGTFNIARVRTIRSVLLSGGSVSGTGTVQTISMASTGTVNPGDNGRPVGVGILHTTGNVTWNSNTTFHVGLRNTNPGSPPVAGIDNDQLEVGGNLILGNGAGSGAQNALLTGSPGAGIQIGDQFTIIRATGTITGLFDGFIGATRAPINDGGVVFLNGQKYTVNYFAQSVVLTRQLAIFSSFTMTADHNASVYGQEVTYTVTAVPEPGASLSTAAPAVNFILDTPLYTQTVAIDKTTGVATFTPQAHFNLLWVPGVDHTVSAVFSDANNVFATANSTPNAIIQKVNLNTVRSIAMSSNPVVTPTTPVYGQAVNIIASISTVVTPDVAGASNPTGNTKFIVDSLPALTYFIPINPYAGPPATQTATLTLPGNLLLSPGPHTVTCQYVGTPNAYGGDGNYAASVAPVSFTLTIQADSTTVKFPTQPTTSNLGQTATFQVQVIPGIPGSIGAPTGFINFYDGSTSNAPLNNSPIPHNGGTVSFSTANLLLGGHTIIATFTSTNANYTGSQKNYGFTVNAATTATAITNVAPPNPTYGQAVVFTMQVAPSPAIAPAFGLPTGTITLHDVSAAGPVLGTGNITSSNGQATVTTTAFGLTTGNHNLFAVYSGNGQFGPSTGTLSLTVAQATTSVGLSANPVGGATWQPSQPIQLTANVTASVGNVPTGSGSVVTFKDGAATLGTALVGAGGVATLASFQSNTLTAGAHNFTATYTDAAGNYATSTGTLNNYAITSAPTTVTSISVDIASGTGVFGQPIALTAAITSPAGVVNVGIVTFVDTSNGNLILGTANVAAGTATLSNITTLTAISHNIKATYTNAANNYFLTSFNTLNGYLVNPAATSITSFTNTPSTSALSQSVAFSVTVVSQNSSTAIVKEGTVRFTDITGAPVVLGTVPVTNGVANLPYASLALGTHTIQAQYLDTIANPNFLASATSTVTQIVRKASTLNVSTIAGAVYGQPLTYTITVTGTPGVPTGTVTLTEGATTLGSDALTTVAGVATAVITLPAGLNPGSHTLVFSYGGDAVPAFGFAPSTKTITQSVAAAGTTTTLDPLSAVPFGTQVTFTATVNTKAPSEASAPLSGSVTFKDGARTLATVNLAGNNVVTFTTTTPLTLGSHTITAIYIGASPLYTASTSPERTQTITAGGTATTLGQLTESNYGQTVTFNATVTSASGATPVGTVKFKDGSVVLSTKTLVNGAASFTTEATQLAKGDYTITAVYTPSNGNFVTSSSAPQIQAVAAATTSTTLTSSSVSNNSIYGQQVTFSATVKVTSAVSPGVTLTPTGTVTFRDGGTTLATVAMVAGKATYKTSILVAGFGHPITATYNPTTPPGNFVTSNDALTQTVDRANTTTKLTSVPAFWAVGQSTNLSATVTSATGAVPVGTVTFTITGPGVYSFTSAALNLVAGKATFAGYVFPGTIGNYTVTATYAPATVPNQNFNSNSASSGSLTQTVRKSTTAALTSVATSQDVALNAKISGVGGVPTGTVSFYKIVNGVQVFLGTGTVNASGVASFFANLASGSHTIHAIYSGDSIFNPASVTGTVQGKVTGRLV